MPVLELQRAAGNRASALAIRTLQRRPRDAETTYRPDAADGQVAADAATIADTATPDKPKPKKVTGFLGMNPDARKELKALRKGAGEDAVLATTGDADLEAKLSDEQAITEFVFDDLGISPGKYDRWSKAIDALTAAGPFVRDALGELMRWMNRAEDGDIVLDRLVLSGHSNGFELWGTPESPRAKQHPGVLIVEQDLGNVAKAFPSAAGQVRSIMFSACETVGAVEAVLRTFPNLDSVWSYAGFSPSVAQGSGEHITAWDKATAGGGTPTKKDAKGATAIWTRQDKWLVHDPGKGNIESLYTQAMSAFEGPVKQMMKGNQEINQSELHRIYLRIQEVVQHPNLSDGQRASAKGVMQVILRLRHWESISRHFAEYAPKLADAYKAFGVTQPNWATITRAQLYRHTRELKKAWEQHPTEKAAAETITTYVYDGLLNLEDKKIIPVEWNE